MDATQTREVFTRILPAARIAEAVERLGVQERARAFQPQEFIFSLILQGGTAEAGRIASVLRDYFERGNPRVSSRAYYRWFSEEFLALMNELRRDATAYVLSMPLHLPGILAGRKDWRVFDSTTVKLPKELQDTFQGTGDYSAIKVHKEYSLGLENVVDWHLSPAREHDAPHLKIDETRRGTGLIVDLGYASQEIIKQCIDHDVHLVLRLKNGWNVYIDDLSEDNLEWAGPTGLLNANSDQPLEIPKSGNVDIDVSIGTGDNIVGCRLVAMDVPNGRVTLLTTISRKTHNIEEIAMLYRLRWSIEVDNKLVKTGCQLDEVQTSKPVAAEILIHAAMLASILSNALCHASHVAQGAVGEKTVKLKEAPLHPILVWKVIITGVERIVQDLMQPDRVGATWQRTTDLVTHGGADINWKTQPSALDDVKGRNRSGLPWRRDIPIKSRKRPSHLTHSAMS